MAAAVAFCRTALRANHAHASSPDKDVTGNLFEYDVNSIATVCTDVLGPDDAAVLVASPEASSDQADHCWWDVYQPADYTIGGRLGTEARLTSVISASTSSNSVTSCTSIWSLTCAILSSPRHEEVIA